MKIGIFDSGIGGLTVFKEISRVLPTFEIVYLGDTARLPYGIKSKKTIDRYSLNNLSFLESQNCEIIVIACNTASSYSTNLLKSKFKSPIFDVISAGVEAAINLEPKKLGIIGTSSTITSKSYNKLIFKKDRNIKVYSKACPIFVPIIEQGLYKEKYYDQIIKENLNSLREKKLDTLILGCTHYPLIKKAISKYIGADVRLVDSASEIADALKKYLKENYPEKFYNKKKPRNIFLTDKSDYFLSVTKKIFKNFSLRIKLVDIK